MHELIFLFSALAVFGVGVTVVDLLGFLDHAGPASAGGHDTGSHDSAGHDGSHDLGSHHDAAHSGQAGHGASYVSPSEEGTNLVARILSWLRLLVYFSLGAGPTGLFGLLTGIGILPSLLWSGGAGLLMAVLARGLRSFIRKDLDSSIKAVELLMDLAVVSVPIQARAMGKAIVRRYDHEMEIFVRARDESQEIPKGATVRIVEFNDDCYFVEPE